VRHGVAPDGRPLRVMPSEDYARMNDADLGALVAYIRQLAPQQGAAAEIQLPLMASLMYGFGLLDDAADRIDHTQPLPPPVPEAASVEHGRYVAQMCIGCHGPGFSGGRIPGTPPDWPAAANLTPHASGQMAPYESGESWARMMRSGRRADGSTIRVMPFEALAKMNDTDLEALRLFLRTLPARPAGGR
jgi:mono/diheme cytochrome c family protein